MRRSTAAIERKCCWDFSDAQAVQRCLHNCFTGKLHPGGSQIETLNRGLTEAAQAAVKIAAGRLEKETYDSGQHRIANIAMEWRHGIWLDASFETISHDQVVPGPQILQKRI